MSSPDPEIISADRAKQGKTGRREYNILIISLALAVIAAAVVLFIF